MQVTKSTVVCYSSHSKLAQSPFWLNQDPHTLIPWRLAVQFHRLWTNIYGVPTCADYRVPRWCGGREPTCQCRRHGLDSWVGKIPWRRKWHPSLVFMAGKSPGQRRLAGYSPWGHKESDMTVQLSTHTQVLTKREVLRRNSEQRDASKGSKETSSSGSSSLWRRRGSVSK